MVVELSRMGVESYVVFERGVRECHFSCLCNVPQK